jgi:carbon-monoxide dehydrogenase medium subunit
VGRPSTPLLSREAIAAAAVGVVDRTGEFTIAQVADALGVRPSSLYNHLSSKGEIVEAILLDTRPPNAGDAYLRFIPRTEMDIAVVSAGVNLTLDEHGAIKTARVALGAAAPTVLLVEEAGQVLIGSKLDEATLERLAKICSGACRPIDDKRGTIEFRRKVAGVLAQRAAATAYKRAGGK